MQIHVTPWTRAIPFLVDNNRFLTPWTCKRAHRDTFAINHLEIFFAEGAPIITIAINLDELVAMGAVWRDELANSFKRLYSKFDQFYRCVRVNHRLDSD